MLHTILNPTPSFTRNETKYNCCVKGIHDHSWNKGQEWSLVYKLAWCTKRYKCTFSSRTYGRLYMWEVGSKGTQNWDISQEVLFTHHIKFLFYGVVHGDFKNSGSRIRLPLFKFLICWDLTRFTYLLSSYFPISKKGVVIITYLQYCWWLNEIMHTKTSVECLAPQYLFEKYYIAPLSSLLLLPWKRDAYCVHGCSHTPGPVVSL